MTEAKDLKRRIRAHMAATHERYSQARRQVLGAGKTLVPPDVAAVVSRARRQRGWTTASAAEVLGTSKLKLDLLERAQASVDSRLVAALAETYDLDRGVIRRLNRLAEAQRQAVRDQAPRLGALSPWAAEANLWMATRGRRSDIWRPKSWITFAIDGDVAYFFEPDPERADWVRNIRRHPEVWLWTPTSQPRPATATEVTSEAEWRRARHLLATKHVDHRDLVEWSTPVAVRVRKGDHP